MEHNLFNKWIEFDYSKTDADALEHIYVYYYLLSCNNNKLKGFVATHGRHNRLNVKYRSGFVEPKQFIEYLKRFTTLRDTKIKHKLNRIVVKFMLNIDDELLEIPGPGYFQIINIT